MITGTLISTLIEKVRPYCDVNTGRVIKPVPKELMDELRRLHLAIGIMMGRPCPYTEASAWWFVFLTPDIASRLALAEA